MSDHEELDAMWDMAYRRLGPNTVTWLECIAEPFESIRKGVGFGKMVSELSPRDEAMVHVLACIGLAEMSFRAELRSEKTREN